MTPDFHQARRMARHMKNQGEEIADRIRSCQAADHGVVALVFTDDCNKMTIETLDEPFEPKVRVYQR